MTSSGPNYTSENLNISEVYSRQDLRNQFGINDATINTGVFRPRNTKSVWLFVTEEKTADKTQYKDKLDGNMLKWQGQLSGRTDQLIISHEAENIELLVFYRRNKSEYPGAAFRYLGRFKYHSHQAGHPASFVLLADTRIS
ncbi:DUF3427 domain-containing protein [Hymenobacter latericus]|uniref:DUF3427 domain-containing protein n=1 Tax=Hymenobacter sp. YIM 151858-1 TaxID=2987688 RepID=UPI00222645B7|nr:DUF3427 domain-containing protein [Hymenobacter sp. YIM 151858-1]UYZ58036.1 DUF3427 domain-containing protein [Hymenobacter sp. YIM 151858-1]